MNILKNLPLAAVLALPLLGTPLQACSSVDLDTGKQLLEARNFTGASEALKPVVEADPKNVEAWVALGRSYFGQRWFDDSEACFKKALDVQKDNGEALYYMGVLTLLKGKMFDQFAGEFFDQAAAVEGPMQDRAQLFKYSMLKYKTIPGRSVTKEFEAWLKASDENDWVVQLGTYLRKPWSNEKLKGIANKRKEAGADPVLTDLDANCYIGMKCQTSLYGIAIDHFKTAMTHARPGNVEWEMSRHWFERLGRKLYWKPALGFDYAPNETGAMAVSIRDRESFALACGLKNGDEIVSLDGMDADFTLCQAIFGEAMPGTLIRMVVKRGEEQKELLLVCDAESYRPNQAPPRPWRPGGPEDPTKKKDDEGDK